MQHPDEGTIHAWLDSELPSEESAALEAHVAECADCASKVAEARGLIAASSRIVSALDIVPGNVIPAPRSARRPWYASTQLRAAAAVLIVAGASMLVIKNGSKRAMEDAVTASAPAATEIPAAPMTVSEPAPMPAASAQKQSPSEAKKIADAKSGAARTLKLAPPSAPKNLEPSADARAERDLSAQSRESAANTLQGAVTGAVAAPAPPPSMPAIAMRRAAEPEFTKIRSDSLGVSTLTVFRTRDSAEVTLTDAAPVQAKDQRVQQSRVLDAPVSVQVTGAAASTAKQKSETEPQILSLTWTDKRGHRMTLRGPVPLTILEQIRATLPPDQR